MSRSILKLILFLLFIVILTPSTQARINDIVIVANVDQSTLSLSKQEVKSLFMGGALEVELHPVSLPTNSPARIVFNTKVLGLTESRVQSYWAQMRFTGRKKPPKQVNSQLELIEFLINTPNSIGYLPKGISLPSSLTVVYDPG